MIADSQIHFPGTKDDPQAVRRVFVELLHPDPLRPPGAIPRLRPEVLALAEAAGQNALGPLLVRPLPGDGASGFANETEWAIVWGFQHWRVAVQLGWETVPVRLAPADPTERDALLRLDYGEPQSNTDGDPVHPLRAFLEDMDAFRAEGTRGSKRSLEWLAELHRIPYGSARHWARLVRLSPDALAAVYDGDISIGHARLLASLPQDEPVGKWLEEICNRGWTVAQAREHMPTKDLPTRLPRPPEPEQTRAPERNLPLEQALQDALGARVELRGRSAGGELTIAWEPDTLSGLADRLAALGGRARGDIVLHWDRDTLDQLLTMLQIEP